jgi:hypothetical protein
MLVAIVFRLVASAGIRLCALVSMQSSGTLYEQGMLQIHDQNGTSVYDWQFTELMNGYV